MPRCPACESFRIVVVVSPERRAFCVRCGARWLQDGSLQRAVRTAPEVLANPEPTPA
jgi:Zn-finger nucleic acid-binding protein